MTFISQEVAQMFDVVDVIFDFAGIITGYAVSPGSRLVMRKMTQITNQCPSA